MLMLMRQEQVQVICNVENTKYLNQRVSVTCATRRNPGPAVGSNSLLKLNIGENDIKRLRSFFLSLVFLRSLQVF